jgi:hypothetical protein
MTDRSSRGAFRKALLLVAFAFIGSHAHASGLTTGPLIHTVVTRFPTENLWESTENHLRNVGDGRLRSEGPTPWFHGGNCGNILENFQEAPLKKMLSDGYIDQKTFEILMTLTQQGISATQLVLFTQYSEMTRDEAEKIFGGPIPKDRNMGLSDSGGVRIRRGTMYYIRGFEAVLGQRNPIAFKPLRVAWELVPSDGKWPSKLSRGFDRTKVPFLVEIGRAFSEKDILPGDTKGLARTLIPYLESEAWAQGIDPSRLVISGHFLDAQHTRFFTRAFPSLRPLRPDLQREMESDLKLSMEAYLQRPLPKDREAWQEYDDTVVVGSLAATAKDFPLSGISSRYQQALTDQQFDSPSDTTATQFMRALQNLHVMMEARVFDVVDGNGGVSEKPVHVADYGSPLLLGDSLGKLHAVGARVSLDNFEAWTESYVPEFGSLHMGTVGKWETDILLPVDIGNEADILSGDFQPLPSFLVSNLDPNLLARDPKTYLTSVILAVAEEIERNLKSTLGDSQKFRLMYAQSIAQLTGRPKMMSLTPADFFYNFPVVVALPSMRGYLDLAYLLGAAEHPGLRMQTEATTGPSNTPEFKVNSQATVERFWKFDYQALQRLRAGSGGRPPLKLRGELHWIRARMAYSGMF